VRFTVNIHAVVGAKGLSLEVTRGHAARASAAGVWFGPPSFSLISSLCKDGVLLGIMRHEGEREGGYIEIPQGIGDGCIEIILAGLA
jgi:hypothetical protein